MSSPLYCDSIRRINPFLSSVQNPVCAVAISLPIVWDFAILLFCLLPVEFYICYMRLHLWLIGPAFNAKSSKN